MGPPTHRDERGADHGCEQRATSGARLSVALWEYLKEQQARD